MRFGADDENVAEDVIYAAAEEDQASGVPLRYRVLGWWVSIILFTVCAVLLGFATFGVLVLVRDLVHLNW